MNPSQMPHAPPPRRNSKFKGDVLRLVSGTGLAQLIAILAAPILTRLYAPEAFGVAALFASITGILGVLACMRYELSIVLPDNDREAANLLGVSLCFSVLIALLTVPIIIFAGLQVLQWVRMPELAPYLWLIPITVLIHGVFTALNYWNTRTKHFTRLSIAQVTSVVASTSATLGAGFAGHATGGAMIAASVGGQVVATTMLGGQIWRDNGRFLVHSITWREMWVGMKRYKKFPIYSSWSALMNKASWQLPVLILGIFFSPVVVGFYAVGFRIIQMPMSLIGSAVSQVFFQRAALANVAGNLPLLVDNLFEKLLIFSLLPSLILMVIGEDIFVFIFGRNWAEAGIYAQILAPWALIWFISSPLSMTYIVLEQNNKESIIQGLILLSRILGLGVGVYLGNARFAILFFAIGGIFSYGYLIKVIFNCCHIKIIDVFRNKLSIFSMALLSVIPLIIMKISNMMEEYILLVAASILTAYLIFYRKKLMYLIAR